MLVASTYVERISDLISVHLQRSVKVTSIGPLLSALGCRTVDVQNGFYPRKLDQPVLPDSDYEDFTRDTLLAAMRFHVDYATTEILAPGPEDGFALLEGLLRKNRWECCLQNETDGRYLVWLLISLSSHSHDKTQAAVYELANMAFCLASSMLNEWLQPKVRFNDRFDTEPMLRGLFGDAWCSLVYPQLKERHHKYRLAGLVYQLRPPFLPGLLPGQPAPAALDLPVLETV